LPNRWDTAGPAKHPTSGRIGALLLGIALSAGFAGGCASKSRVTADPVPATPAVPVLEAIDAYSEQHPINSQDPGWKTRVPRPPTVRFDPARSYYWYLHTSEGVLKIELKPEWAPRHVSSTIYLTRLGFYDGLSFHRIIPKFMVQGGDPLGTGAGSPGFQYGGEFHRKAKHSKRGVVSMANAGPRTDGSQFFILFDAADQLNGKHTVFGQVVEGLGTLRSLEAYGSESGKPRRVVVIRRAEVRVE